MKFLKDTTWEEVFSGWRAREAHNPNWIHCATEVKGWPDWESWRQHTVNQIHAKDRGWKIFEFTDPMEEISEILIGPFSGWQSRVHNKNKTSFRELLEIPEQYEYFSNHSGVLNILNGLPFTTEFIGVIRDDLNKIVCLEGHHRATAIALARRHKKSIDFSSHSITIALAHLPENEIHLLDKMLKRGTSKNPQN